MAKISIIIPIYNAEKHIKRTLDSVINQTYINMEIILVDDGSTDSSIEISNRYKKIDKRITLIKRKHAGAAEARNAGLDIASGDFLMFLDADDYFDNRMVEKMLLAAETENADLVVCGYDEIVLDGGNEARIIKHGYNKKIEYGFVEEIDILGEVKTVPWNKLIKRELINDNKIKFQNISSENDLFFSFAVRMNARKTVFIEERYINYFHGHANSISMIRDNEKNNIVLANEAVLEYIDKVKKKDVFAAKYLNMFLNNLTYIFSIKDNDSIKDNIIFQLKNSKYFKDAFEKYSGSPALQLRNQKIIEAFLSYDIYAFDNTDFLFQKDIKRIIQYEEIVIYGYGYAGKAIGAYLKKHYPKANISYCDRRAKTLVGNDSDKIYLIEDVSKNAVIVVGFLFNIQEKINDAVERVTKTGISRRNVILIDMDITKNFFMFSRVWDIVNDKSYSGTILSVLAHVSEMMTDIIDGYSSISVNEEKNCDELPLAIEIICKNPLVGDNSKSLYICSDVFSAYYLFEKNKEYALVGYRLSKFMSENDVYKKDKYICEQYRMIEEKAFINAYKSFELSDQMDATECKYDLQTWSMSLISTWGNESVIYN